MNNETLSKARALDLEIKDLKDECKRLDSMLEIKSIWVRIGNDYQGYHNARKTKAVTDFINRYRKELYKLLLLKTDEFNKL